MKALFPRIFALCSVTTLLLALPASHAGNPIITHMNTADPSAHVWKDGRLYLYPSTDIYPARGCDLMDQYHVFSTDDMVTWKDHGEILRASQVPWGRPEGGFMWAPDCAFRNDTYYYYFPHPSGAGQTWNSTWKIGVATSKYPDRDFKALEQPIAGIGGFAMIDPCVFMDDDGQAYIYIGGGGKCVGAKLKENMVELDGPTSEMEGLQDFHEAPWVFKRNGLYYMTHSDNHNTKEPMGGNRLCYATSSSPLGPWTPKGVYLEPVGRDTSHGSVVEFKGQWYAFYHEQLRAENGLRMVCVDKLFFNTDGTIQTVQQTRSPKPSRAHQ